MLYNDIISYNQSGVSYSGILQINVPGFLEPIIVNDITIYFVSKTDYSNATTIGLVSIDYVASGIIVIEATAAQAEAISESSLVALSNSSYTTIESISDYSGSTAEVLIISDSPDPEIAIGQ